ncbi:MAG: 2,3-diphosphoglycerate-dependent phosphoglycerate mutase [Pseudomonadota bacterium]
MTRRATGMLVLIRHGQSEWNLENRFTGWWDVNLSPKGVDEARTAGKMMAKAGFSFDVAFTSLLTRAIRTLNLALEEMGDLWLPVVKDWRLNERHYGDLTGYNKAEKAAEVGDEQVFVWRRSFDIPPPPLAAENRYSTAEDRRYAFLSKDALPATESLKDTIVRVLPYWESEIVPQLKAGKNVIISAHGNSLRALVKHLNGISDEDIAGVEIPTGKPLVYHLDDELAVQERYYLHERP